MFGGLPRSLSVPSVYRLVIAHIFHALHMCVNGACVHVRVKKSKINMLPLCLVSMYMTIDHIDDAYMSISFVCMCDHIIGLGMWTLVFFLHLWLSVACTLLLLSCNIFHVINVVCVCECVAVGANRTYFPSGIENALAGFISAMSRFWHRYITPCNMNKCRVQHSTILYLPSNKVGCHFRASDKRCKK